MRDFYNFFVFLFNILFFLFSFFNGDYKLIYFLFLHDVFLLNSDRAINLQ